MDTIELRIFNNQAVAYRRRVVFASLEPSLFFFQLLPREFFFFLFTFLVQQCDDAADDEQYTTQTVADDLARQTRLRTAVIRLLLRLLAQTVAIQLFAFHATGALLERLACRTELRTAGAELAGGVEEVARLAGGALVEVGAGKTARLALVADVGRYTLVVAYIALAALRLCRLHAAAIRLAARHRTLLPAA